LALWKQLLGILAAIAVAAYAVLAFVPGGRAYLAGLGLVSEAPNSITAGGDPALTGNKPETGGGRRSGGQPALVVVVDTIKITINDRLTALGTGKSVQSATLTPSASGLLTELLVDSGADVTAGQVVAALDPASAQVAYDAAKIVSDDANMTLARTKNLGSSLSVSGTQMQAYQLAANRAELAMRQAKIDLNNRKIVSPIDGTIGLIAVNPGVEVTQSTVIATVEDNSIIKVNFDLPERYVGKVKPGAPVTVHPIALPGLEMQAVVGAIDNRIDAASGSFEIEARIPNPDRTLRSGMSFTMTMQFPGDTYIAVTPLAVQWGSDGAYVWRVSDHKVQRVPISVVQRNAESVLVSGDLALGDQIVSEGLDALKDGATVRLVGEAQDGAPVKRPAPAAGN